MEYYFTKRENIDTEKNKLVVDNFEYKHLVRVLRKKEGDELTITDGERNIYNCRIIKINKDNLSCEIISKDFNLYEPDINISLYIAPLRNSGRFEFAIEKAVELGVSSIHPVITEFTVSKTSAGFSKAERLKKIIIGAMGQSQRCLLPKLYETIDFKKMIDETAAEKNKIVMYEYSHDSTEIKLNKESEGLCLLIGPEGGFSNSEIQSLQENNWHVKSLGKRKLRAETAAIVSVFDIISKLNQYEN